MADLLTLSETGSPNILEREDNWYQFLRDAWPDTDDKSRHMKCANTLLDDNIAVVEFTHDRDGFVKNVGPSNDLSLAKALDQNREAWVTFDSLCNWNGEFVLMPVSKAGISPQPVANTHTLIWL